MNVAEIFIAHMLYDNPDKLHVTPDGEKLYFLLKGNLMYIEAPKGTSYNRLNDEELNHVLQDALNQSTTSH
jgi:hypothetical protein